ncbi:MAG: hypothetical protein H7843_09110 [Nitrospirota bacterium]
MAKNGAIVKSDIEGQSDLAKEIALLLKNRAVAPLKVLKIIVTLINDEYQIERIR